jgi:ribulose-bisphosphate carboxylase large chain
MPADRIEADYLLETPIDPRRAAETIAGEQSSGTFVPVPGETPELKERSTARVAALEILEEAAPRRSLPSASREWGGERITRSRMTLSWPLATLGPSLPNLVATVAGNLFELSAVSGLRLLDIRMPPAFADAYPGPRFGVEGTRRLAGVQGRPLIGTIVKPSVGLDAEATAALVKELCEAGIDFIKDDELQSDGPACPFDERVRAVMRVIEAQADRTGKKTMYAFNLTGDLDQMRRRHDALLAHGATCLMASLNSVGLVGMVELGRFSQLPIHAHRNGWGYLSRHPLLGWSYVAWQKLWRLAGADHMHVNGLQNKFSEPDESVVESARACLASMFDGKPCTVMPVFSSGQTVRQAHGTYAALRSTDLIVTAGGGIVAHPGGPAAGVRAMREAWEAAVAGIPLEEHARNHRELARALEIAA